MRRCLNCMEEYEDSRGICPQCHYGEGGESGTPFVLRAGTILQGRYIVGTCRGIRDCDITYIGWDALFDRKVMIQEFFPSRCACRDGGEDLAVKNGMEELFREGLDRYVHYHRNLIRLYREEDIISVFSCFRANQTAYATMQYSEALTLGQWIGQDGRLDERDAVAFLYQAVQAVKKVHDLGLVHGDVRMDQFWMTGTGGLVLKGFAEPCHYCGDPEQRDYGNVGGWIDVCGLSRLFGKMLLGEEDVSDNDILDMLEDDSLKLPVRTIMAVKGGLGRNGNHRILSLDELSERIFGDSATMRLVNRADRSRRRGGRGAARKKALDRQNLLAGGAVAAVVLVAALFFTMGRFTGTMFTEKGHNKEASWPDADGNTEQPGNAAASDAAGGKAVPEMKAAGGKAVPEMKAAGGKAASEMKMAAGKAVSGTKAATGKTASGTKAATGKTVSGTKAAGEKSAAETKAAGKSAAAGKPTEAAGKAAVVPVETSAQPSPSTTATPGPSTTATPGPSAAATSGPSAAATSGPSTAATSGPSAAATSGPSTAATSGPSAAATSGPSTAPASGPSDAGEPSAQASQENQDTPASSASGPSSENVASGKTDPEKPSAQEQAETVGPGIDGNKI